MVITGIFSPDHSAGIEKIMRKTTVAAGSKYLLLKPENIGIIKQLSKDEVKNVILILDNRIERGVLKNLVLDVFICDNKTIPPSEVIMKLVSKNTVVIINADDSRPVILPNSVNVITYGLSMRSTITASSIEKTCNTLKLNYCIQRQIKSINGTRYEMAEFPVVIEDTDIYHALPAVTWSLVTDLAKENNYTSMKI